MKPLVYRVPNEHRRRGDNSTYALTEDDRDHLFLLWWLNLWPNQWVADAFGVNRATIDKVRLKRYINDGGPFE